MSSDNIYCRLCAELKPNNIQVDLQSDSKRRGEIIQKLTRINATTEFSENKLPCTVCRECLGSLNICFEFVVNIERAQKVLSDMIIDRNVKYEMDNDAMSRASWKMEYLSDNEVPVVKDNHSDADSLNDINRATENIFQQPLKVEYQSGDEERAEKPDVDVAQMKPKYTDVELRKKTVHKKYKKSDTESVSLSQIETTWADYNWRCTHCESRFPTIEELQSHSMAAHGTCNPYRCTECNFRKGRLDKFLNHVKTHHKEFKYSCYRCYKKFNNALMARRHKVAHIHSKFNCPGCRATFKNSVQLKHHSETYYQVKKTLVSVPQISSTDGLTCLKCSKTFKTKGNLKSHIIYMHTDRKQNFVCDACGKSFFDRSSLTQHMLTHRGDRPHKCHICKLGFKTLPVLKDHIGRHNNDRPFSCEQCGSSFRLQRDLKKHSAMHSGAMPFQCSYCDKRFQRRQYLTNHERLHTGEKPYSCDACHHAFSDWPNYNKHMKQRHNIDTSKKKALSE